MVSILTGFIGLAVAAVILVLVRRDKLHVNHALGWVLVAAGFALMGFAPGVFDSLAGILGIHYPPTLALTIAIAILTVKILAMDIERSRNEVRTQRLIQKMAILESELSALRRRSEPSGESPPEEPR